MDKSQKISAEWKKPDKQEKFKLYDFISIKF